MPFFIGDENRHCVYGPSPNLIDMYKTNPNEDINTTLYLYAGTRGGEVIRKLATWDNTTRCWMIDKILMKVYILWLLVSDKEEHIGARNELYDDIDNSIEVVSLDPRYDWHGRWIATLYIGRDKQMRYAYTFIPQDEGKDTDYGKLARNGHKILWVTKRLVGQQKGELIGGFEDGIWRNSGGKSIYFK